LLINLFEYMLEKGKVSKYCIYSRGSISLYDRQMRMFMYSHVYMSKQPAYISNLLRSSDDKLSNSTSGLAKMYKIRSESNIKVSFLSNSLIF